MKKNPEEEERKNVTALGNCIQCRLAHYPSKRGAVLEVLHQILNAAKVSTEKFLLLFSAKRHDARAVCTFAAVLGGKGTSEFARAALEHGWYGIPLVGSWYRGGFGHEVAVEEFDQLQLDFS